MHAYVNFSRGFIFANKARLNKNFGQIILDFIVTNMPTESEEKVYKPRQKKKRVAEKNVIVENNMSILAFLKKENSLLILKQVFYI